MVPLQTQAVLPLFALEEGAICGDLPKCGGAVSLTGSAGWSAAPAQRLQIADLVSILSS